MANGTCSIDDCDRPVVGRGWCSAHWNRWSVHGDPLADKRVELYRAIDHDDGTRTCSKCRERKPLDDFHRVKGATLGRRSDCKVCRGAQMSAWHAANREQRAAKKRAWQEANPDIYRQRQRERNNLPERREKHAIRVARRRTRLAGAEVDPGVTRANLRKQYGDACFYCAQQMTFKRIRRDDPWPSNLATLEHVHPVALGGTHTWDNVVLACWRCNCSKKATPHSEWNPSVSPTAPA